MSDKDRAKELFFLALGFLDARNFEQAEAFFLETLKFAPNSVPILNNLAVAQYEQKRLNEAAQMAQRVITIEQHNIDARSMVLACQLERHDRAGALYP